MVPSVIMVDVTVPVSEVVTTPVTAPVKVVLMLVTPLFVIVGVAPSPVLFASEIPVPATSEAT
jgi:hypothetical protein